MPHDDRALGQALGARGSHVVLSQHVEHAGPREPDDEADQERAERDGRQHQVLRRPPARHGQPAEIDGEDDDQHEPQPEHGHRLAQERERHRPVIPEREPLDGGDDADRHPDEEREDERAGGEQERRGQPLQDHLERGPLGADRSAEVPGDRVPEKARVLHDEGLVEAERRTQVADLLGRGLFAEHHRRRIPGREMEQREHHDGDEPQERDRLQRSPDEGAQHSLRSDGSDRQHRDSRGV